MQLHKNIQSLMTLPGKYQPKLHPKWQVNDAEVAAKYLTNSDRSKVEIFSFDPVYMGDGQPYSFNLMLTDERYHGFYQDKE